MSESREGLADDDEVGIRIYELTMRRLCGDLTAEECNELEQLVCGDPAACTWFVDAMVETAALHYHTGGGHAGGGHIGSGVDLSALSIAINDLRATNSRSPDGTEPAKTKVPVLGFLADSLRAALPGGMPFSPTLFALAMLLASLSWVAMAVWVIPWWRRQPQVADAQVLPAPPSVARLTASENCRWRSHAAPSIGADFGSEILEITSGIAEFTLFGGTRVVVEGPARLRAESPGLLRLDEGRLVANVPELAVGFTVVTPTAAVVDLGTEFGVEVDRAGQTEVHTLRGQVSVNPIATPNTPASSGVTVSAGQAVRVGGGGTQAAAIPFAGATFPKARGSTTVAAPIEPAERPEDEREFSGSIRLGNLFDDPRHASLASAMRSDTFRAIAEVDDLGIERVLYAGDAVKQICPGVRFDFTNLGWASLQFGQISNDTWTDSSPASNGAVPMGGIRTRGAKIEQTAPFAEDGIGTHANSLITFDLAEIRSAGRLRSRELQFVCDRAGINDSGFSEPGATVHMLVLVSDRQSILAGSLDGQPADIAARSGVWSITSAVGTPLGGDGQFVAVRLVIPPQARYLTLVATSAGDGYGSDQAVWSGARLEVK